MKSFGSFMILHLPCFAANFLERTKDDSANYYVYVNRLTYYILGSGRSCWLYKGLYQNLLLEIKTKN